ncbi:ComEC/Rec2 family competence protein [Verrucomicrobia bacterium S94]|nr:ComEC/Rec2 family competence protein [Verrucomicrobia bacterium S94]
MVGIALATAAGMLASSTGIFPLSLLFSAAALSVGTAFIFMRKSEVPIFAVVALTAALRFGLTDPDLAADSINRTEMLNVRAGVKGRIAGEPRFYAYPDGVEGTWTFPVQCLEYAVSNKWKTTSGSIDLQIHAAPVNIDFETGDLLLVHGWLAEKTFPGKNRLELEVKAGNWKRLERGGGFSPGRWGRSLRDSLAPRLEQGMRRMPVQLAVLKALVLGFREDVPRETIDVFKRTGSMHIFAISGLHVGIVGFLLALVLKMLGLPRGKFGLVLIPLLGLYVLSTGMKSSALRALLMAAVFLLAPLFKRKPDIPSSVAFAAVVLLYFQPLEILSPGFIFSFTVVSFLVMAFSAVPRHWVQGPWIKTYAVSLVITSVAAGSAAIPLTALFFGRFSPIALLGNLIVVPLTFCIVLCGWLSIVLPFVSSVFNHAAAVFIDLLLGSVHLLDWIPGGNRAVEPPSLIAVLLWLGSQVAIFTACTTRRQREVAIGCALCAVCLVLFGG